MQAAYRHSNKLLVLEHIARGRAVLPMGDAGRDKYRIGDDVVHGRYRSGPKKGQPAKYSFNINPNTLSADWELWICGQDGYYLIPITDIKLIYDDPHGYVDRRHPEIRVCDIDLHTHRASFARGGKYLDFSRYFRATL
jgi:hypothetical protein